MTALVVTASILGGFITQSAALVVAARRPLFGVLWYGTWTVICAVLSGLDLVAGLWVWAPVMAVCAALNAWFCWACWNRCRRKPADALAGAKSRARVTALVRKARETARPRQVLRPVPGSRS